MVTEDSVFGERLARFDRREKCPKVRANVVEVVALVDVIFKQRLFADFWIVFGVPLFEVGITHRVWKTVRVITQRGIFAGLRIVSEAELGDFENSMRAL